MPILIHPGKCDQSDACLCPSVCPQGAWTRDASDKHWQIDEKKCANCGVCVHMCPAGAVIFAETEEEKNKILEDIKNDTVHTPETLFVERYGGDPITEDVVIDTQSFDTKVSEGIILVEFFNADSTGCLFKSPAYHEFAPDLLMYKIDAESNPELKQRFEIKILPTLIVFNDGKEVGRTEGFVDDVNTLKSRISKFI